mgnify:FL=1
MGTAWHILGELTSFVGAILPCATVPIPVVSSCQLSGVGFFKSFIMNIERTEFIAWMKRIMQRFDIIDELYKAKSNSLQTVDGEELLDNQDVLLMLKISNRSLQRYRSDGKLPYYSISGKIYYKRSDVEQVIRDSFSRSVAERKKKREV